MKSPKSILLINRSNLLWLNIEIIPTMRKMFNTRFTIVSTSKQKPIYDKIIEKNDSFIASEDLKSQMIQSIKQERQIFKEAKFYEDKYNVNFFRDGILQDREYSYKFISSYKPDASLLHQEAINNKENHYLKVIHEMNFYFNYFEKIFSKHNIDLLISRPDDLRGFALTSISAKNNIPTTFQTTARENGFYMWADGPYQSHNLIFKNIQKNKKIKKYFEKSKNDSVIASHAFKYNKRHLDEVSLSGTINSIVFLLKDRLNFFLKDINKGKILKRPGLIIGIKEKIRAYLENKFLNKIF